MAAGKLNFAAEGAMHLLCPCSKVRLLSPVSRCIAVPLLLAGTAFDLLSPRLPISDSQSGMPIAIGHTL
jgi:hypothetical protein